MYIVHVFITVKENMVNDFTAATLNNVKNSIEEEGVARFDFIKQTDSHNKFILVEVYKNESAATLHKETEHYKLWRNNVETMMEQPRTSVKFTNIAPNDNGW